MRFLRFRWLFLFALVLLLLCDSAASAAGPIRRFFGRGDCGPGQPQPQFRQGCTPFGCPPGVAAPFATPNGLGAACPGGACPAPVDPRPPLGLGAKAAPPPLSAGQMLARVPRGLDDAHYAPWVPHVRAHMVDRLVARGVSRPAAEQRVAKIGDGTIIKWLQEYGPMIIRLIEMILPLFLHDAPPHAVVGAVGLVPAEPLGYSIVLPERGAAA